MTQTILSAASTFQTAGSCYHKILAGRIACVTKATRRRPFEAAALFPSRSERAGN